MQVAKALVRFTDSTDPRLVPMISYAGFPQALEIMENLENHEKKVPCMKKSWNLEKSQNNHGKIMEFCEII